MRVILGQSCDCDFVLAGLDWDQAGKVWLFHALGLRSPKTLQLVKVNTKMNSSNQEVMACMYTTKYYVALRRNKIMPLAATWLELQDLMLNEVNLKNKWIDIK